MGFYGKEREGEKTRREIGSRKVRGVGWMQFDTDMFGPVRNQPFISFSAFVAGLSNPRSKPWPANIIVRR